MLPPQTFFENVAAAFGLGTLKSSPVEVSGGLSNRLYRAQTDRGDFAIKQMVANANSSAFKSNVEAAFQVELAALAAGIAMPQPVPAIATGDALARIPDGDNPSWVRVHHWIAGEAVNADQMTPHDFSSLAGILATMHQMPAPKSHEKQAPPPPRDWKTTLPADLSQPGLVNAISEMEAIVREGYATIGPSRVMSHRDLDAKNLLRAESGELIVIDWDAAGPVVAEWDAVTVALDWANARGDAVSSSAFDGFLATYANAGGREIDLTPGRYAGWCESVLDWMWFNLGRTGDADPVERELGRSEVRDSARFIPSVARWIANRP